MPPHDILEEMTHFLITTCCKEKDPSPGRIPAVQRYIDPRISWVYRESQQQNLSMLILSGKFGLVKPEDEIGWYDHALLSEEVSELVPILIDRLTALKVSQISFYAQSKDDPGWAPYHTAMEQACQKMKIRLEWIPWEDSLLLNEGGSRN